MATGSLTISVTIPVTNAVDPNNVGRNIALQMLDEAAQAIGGNLAQTSGNLVYSPTIGNPQVIGTWTFTAGT